MQADNAKKVEDSMLRLLPCEKLLVMLFTHTQDRHAWSWASNDEGDVYFCCSVGREGDKKSKDFYYRLQQVEVE